MELELANRHLETEQQELEQVGCRALCVGGLSGKAEKRGGCRAWTCCGEVSARALVPVSMC